MLALAFLASCGPDARPTADLDPVCGEPGPHRVLELDGGTAPLSTYSGIQRFGDRIYAIVGAAPHRSDAQIDGADYWPTPLPASTTVWSFGPCGESPRVVAEDLLWMTEHERWPGAVLGRTGLGEGDIVVVDPEGIEPQRTFIRDVGSLDPWTDVGVLATLPRGYESEAPRTLRLTPYPERIEDAPRAPETLLENVVYGTVEGRGGEAFAVTTAGDAVVIDLNSRETTTLWTGVGGLDVSQDGRWVVVTEASADAQSPRAVQLIHRDAGTVSAIGEATNACCDAEIFPDDVVRVPLDGETGFSTRLVTLPSLEAIDVPSPLSVYLRIEDGRWLTQRAGTEYLLYDHETGDLEPLFDGPSNRWSMSGERMELLQTRSFSSPDAMREEAKLWEVTYDGSEPELLARRATPEWMRLADGRVATPLDIGEDYLGQLVVIDPQTLDELWVDDDVFMHLPTQNHEPVFDDEDALAYSVVDGDRSGIWLTRVAAD